MSLIIDLAVNYIHERFDLPGYEVYRDLELLLKASESRDIATEFENCFILWITARYSVC